MKAAIVLLSGGLDSATVGAMAREQGFALHALSFDYGQRHVHELAAARRIADALEVHEHVLQTIDLRAFGGSALTADIDVPKDRPDIGGTGIPVTYVPARNTIFLSFALAFAETRGADDIFIGVNALDYSGYPDCRPEYLAKFQELARLATRAGVEGRAIAIHAPLIEMSKAEIIRTGIRLGVDYSQTTSCYDPDTRGLACGRCDSCVLRMKGFADADVADPTRYQRDASPPASVEIAAREST
ncbi:MAG: 7-cyano-7-deazaguanine synthase QueC [Planctomycetota bacterium]|nr:7-cyano-7-deazaguanine synthase QueC [Planctomycetota bacterium]